MAISNPSAILWEGQFAREVQDRIFPTARPSIPNLDYYSDWRPAAGVRGDYLDYFEADGGNLCLTVGEVSGNGRHTGLLTAALHSIVRALRFSHAGSLTDFMRTVDELFTEVCPDHCHATLFVARYDPVSSRLHYVNAGQEPPFVLRSTGRWRGAIRLESGGPVIGMMRKAPYRERVITLHPGDLLVAYTDGLCETANALGEEWGWRRFLDAIQSGGGQRPRDIVERVFEEIDEFAAGVPAVDDRTLWVGHIPEVCSRPLRAAESAEPVAA